MSTNTDLTIKAAMGIAKDIAEGRLSRTELDQAVVEQCRELFGTVVGPADPLFDLQIDIARGVLAVGGLPADELSEWTAVARSREAAAPEGTDGPSETVSSLSEAVSLDSGHSERGVEPSTNT